MLGDPHGGYQQKLIADHVGTRLEHMMDLQMLWSTAYAYLTRPGYHTKAEEERAKALETALALLQHHMEAEYNQLPYAKEINALPKDARKITEGGY
jgi:hypothetical protein